MDLTKIHVIDDDERTLSLFAQMETVHQDMLLSMDSNARSGRERLQKERPDIVVISLDSPEIHGTDLLLLARKLHPSTPVIVTTSHPTIDSAVQFTKKGASNYLSKPLDFNIIWDLARKVRHEAPISNALSHTRNNTARDNTPALSRILGLSHGMIKVFDEIKHIAATNVDVLITGETGTGKELVARALHEESDRRDYPFVPVDCGAIPNELMESELFGHEKGAFTGAQSRAKGLLEHAHHGTFFLDEITQLPPRMQAKLLRVLQERQIRRVGGLETIDLDIRIISASSLDLEQEVEKQRFRIDLYHRIHVASVNLPPLRERPEDILLLAKHFLKIHAREMNRPVPELASCAVEMLKIYPWPGNVRQLENVMKRTLAMHHTEVIKVAHLPESMVQNQIAKSLMDSPASGFFEERKLRIAVFEKQYLEHLLTHCKGDITKVMAESKLPRGTLYRLLKKCELDPACFR